MEWWFAPSSWVDRRIDRSTPLFLGLLSVYLFNWLILMTHKVKTKARANIDEIKPVELPYS